jgi:hypothetical protein
VTSVPASFRYRTAAIDCTGSRGSVMISPGGKSSSVKVKLVGHRAIPQMVSMC